MLLRGLVDTPAGGFDPAAGTPSTVAAGGAPDAGLSEREGWASPDFTRRERAILAYADRLTTAPASVTETDIHRLRGVGLDDRAIHDVCAIASYFAFVNRMADGLGVELEDDDREWKDGG